MFARLKGRSHRQKKFIKFFVKFFVIHFNDFARYFNELTSNLARNFNDLTINLYDFRKSLRGMYLHCTVLYSVRYVYALVHIPLCHVIGGGNFWEFYKSAQNSIKSAGNLTRNLYK